MTSLVLARNAWLLSRQWYVTLVQNATTPLRVQVHDFDDGKGPQVVTQEHDWPEPVRRQVERFKQIEGFYLEGVASLAKPDHEAERHAIACFDEVLRIVAGGRLRGGRHETD